MSILTHKFVYLQGSLRAITFPGLGLAVKVEYLVASRAYPDTGVYPDLSLARPGNWASWSSSCAGMSVGGSFGLSGADHAMRDS